MDGKKPKPKGHDQCQNQEHAQCNAPKAAHGSNSAAVTLAPLIGERVPWRHLRVGAFAIGKHVQWNAWVLSTDQRASAGVHNVELSVAEVVAFFLAKFSTVVGSFFEKVWPTSQSQFRALKRSGHGLHPQALCSAFVRKVLGGSPWQKRSRFRLRCWSEWQDLNLRPPRPERGALPDCATLRHSAGLITRGPDGLQARPSPAHPYLETALPQSQPFR